ncbi:lipopolysaccharide transport periplasmic protein LptA [Thalassotalea ponticola]|uniref:lipopolysaccharide transport periplasmic protein LptA n=1 Tax=Thalassotalea ponticola TaxID=1523392 RepID=UPI0025B3C4A6|nr:lipopolysaccharide transport periplasmic protein LptA [Thalassotalea ponticola]MDN3653515.1 lipopolysaccharide transport periplasmic protein LptA [Thalassotalea ponticola]
MYRQSLKNAINKLVIALPLCFVSHLSIAQQADFEQDIKIVAKKQATDLKKRIASYSGNVKITQGSLTISADLVQVIDAKEAENKKYLAQGKPATFSQQLDNGDTIKLQANEITYSPYTSTLVIRGNAKVSQQDSMVQGDVITYNLETEQLTADGDGTGIVTTIIAPDKKSKKTTEPESEKEQ